MVPNPDESDLIDRKATTIIQYIVGTMLYYAQLVDPNMLRAIDEILRVQSRPTQDTEEKARMLIYYVTTYPTEILHYKARDMVLHMDSDLAYLTMPEARSCYADHFYLSDFPSPSPIKNNLRINCPIHTYCKKIRNVMSSAAESETICTLNNRKRAIVM